MSGLLSRLIQRSLSPPSGVRPRLGSVFEPATPSPETMRDAAIDTLATDRTNRTGTQRQRNAEPDVARHSAKMPLIAVAPTDVGPRQPAIERASHPVPLPPPATRDPIADAEQPPGSETLTQAQPRRKHTPIGNAAERRTTPEAMPRHFDATPTAALRHADVSDSTTATQVRRVGPEKKPSALPQPSSAQARVEAAPRPRDRATHPSVLEPRTDASAPETPRDHAHDASPAPAPTQAQAILKPRLPYPEPVAQSAQPSASLPTEPTVHVTIGRVEIRAVAAAATPTRAAPPKPALSLSDYLQRRDGGRR